MSAKIHQHRQQPASTVFTIQEIPLPQTNNVDELVDAGYEGDIEVRYPDEYLEPSSPTSPRSDTYFESEIDDHDINGVDQASGPHTTKISNSNADINTLDKEVMSSNSPRSAEGEDSSNYETHETDSKAFQQKEDIEMAEQPSLAAQFSGLGFSSRQHSSPRHGRAPSSELCRTSLNDKLNTTSTRGPSTSHKRTHSETFSPPPSSAQSRVESNDLGQLGPNNHLLSPFNFTEPGNGGYESETDSHMTLDLAATFAQQNPNLQFSPHSPSLHYQQTIMTTPNRPETPSTKRARRHSLFPSSAELTQDLSSPHTPRPSSPVPAAIVNAANPLPRKRSYAISNSPATSPVQPAFGIAGGGVASSMDVD